jgi:hypothetical protein
MKRFALFIACLFLSLSCFAQVPEKEQAAIIATVDTMLAGLKSGDSEVAFAQHVPEVRAQFGTAAEFAKYLRENYPVLSDHASAVVIDVDVHQGTVMAATVVDYDGTIWPVVFSMEVGRDGNWLISGCKLMPTTQKGV